MSSEKRKPPPPEQQESVDPPKMDDGKFYDLNPPASVTSGTFRRIQCMWRFPQDKGRFDSYMVSGIPEGMSEVKEFVLQFSDSGVTVTPALEQAHAAHQHDTVPKPRAN